MLPLRPHADAPRDVAYDVAFDASSCGHASPLPPPEIVDLDRGSIQEIGLGPILLAWLVVAMFAIALLLGAPAHAQNGEVQIAEAVTAEITTAEITTPEITTLEVSALEVPGTATNPGTATKGEAEAHEAECSENDPPEPSPEQLVAMAELQAVRAELGPEMGLYDAPGALMVRSATSGRYYRFPAVQTEIELDVTGVVVRGSVRQVFRNPAPVWVEGVYVFPLPEDAAVDTLRLEVGERVIEGQVKERAAARRTYEQARTEGRVASLVEQERPNVFTNSVANIGPGDEVVVTLEYQHLARWDSGSYRLRVPTVVAPRYIPGSTRVSRSPGEEVSPEGPQEPLVEDLGAVSGHGWARNTDQVSDASRITPPVLPPGQEGRNGLQIEVRLEPGFELARLESPFFPIEVEEKGEQDQARHHVRLAMPDAIAHRDFELVWAPRRGSEPRAALLTETLGADTYGLLMVLPPQELFAQQERLPRELVLVVDTSGSMHGASILQAQRALLEALNTLREGDTFNILRFASSTSQLFSESQLATTKNLDRARAWVRGLDANGGTEMMGALQAALANQNDPSRLRQVIFVTDGAVGNEDALFAAIEGRLGASRLFTVGIGSAPNSHFMRRAANFGRGTFTHIGDLHQVQRAMGELFAKIESPQLAGLAVSWPDANAEMWPQRLPDLYRGEPLVAVVRMAPSSGAEPTVRVEGRSGERPWAAALSWQEPIAGGSSGAPSVDPTEGETPGISRLWARHKIEGWMDELTLAPSEDVRTQLREGVLELALEHHLVSKFTSLVAVDVTPTRPQDQVLESRPVPVELPAGWSWGHVFGGAVHRAPVAPSDPASPTAPAAGTQLAQASGSLPQGSTGSRAWLLLGMGLLLAALVVSRESLLGGLLGGGR
ncbi:MAG: marine proteobacterial sortase target protein [Acidobacteriota bacterium]